MASCADIAAPLAARIDALAPGARRLRIRFWDGSELPSAVGGDDVPVVVLRSPRAIAHVAWRPGELGISRAWVGGEVDVADGDLGDVLALRGRFEGLPLGPGDLALLTRTAHRLGALRGGRPPIPASEFRRRGRRHSVGRDRVAVRHHYDVSNDFYRLVLGPTMVYSCAYFADQAEPVDTAQERKLELICRKLRLRAGERLLDVGCGWGSLVLHAAREHGVRAVGVTLSEPQARLARERAAEAGLSDRVEIRVLDYREIPDGPFDKIASVGMYEHVGASQLGTYFARVRALLRPGGLFLNHGISRLAPRPPRRPWSAAATFINRYVFPDGELHPVSTVVAAAEGAGLEVRDDESLREHYALTLRRWLANLAEHREAAIRLAGADRERIWRLYMTGSAQAFEAGEITIHQVLCANPGAPHPMPLAREMPLTERAASA